MDDETRVLFRAEAQGLVESLEAGLLSLRDRPADREVIDRVFRDLHTLKGTGSMFGQSELAGFVHDFESAFEAVRSGQLPATPGLIAISLRVLDHVVTLLEGNRHQCGEAFLSDLSLLLGAHGPSTLASNWRLRFRLPEDTLALGGRPELVLDELRGLGATRLRALVADIPPPEELETAGLRLGWEVVLPASVPEDAIRKVFLFHAGADPRLDRAEPPTAPLSDARVSVHDTPEAGLVDPPYSAAGAANR